MALLLHIETSTTNCSVALSDNHQLIAVKEHNNGYTHNENLNVFIDELLKQHGCSYVDLAAISVSIGPGSYTGLRIGVSAAKGLGYALDIPIIGIETLTAFSQYSAAKSFVGTVIPMLDARRMEVYAAVFKQGEKIRETAAEVITETSFDAFSDPLFLYGPGADKLTDLLADKPEITIEENVVPSATHLIDLAYKKYQTKDFVDTAYFEPFYLKNFIAGKPKELIKRSS